MSLFSQKNEVTIMDLQKEIINLKQKTLILEKKNDLVIKENSTLKAYIKKKEFNTHESNKYEDNKINKKSQKIVQKYQDFKNKIEELGKYQ